MKLLIVAIGHKMPDWIAEGCQEYTKRMPRELPIQIIELKPEPRSGGKTREQLTAAEAGRIEAALPSGCRIIALDERGDDLTTVKLSQQLEKWMGDGRDVALLIGGADGLAASIKDRADGMIRLSSLTLPHAMARLLLCEQLYRAYSLLKGHPYHRE
jgi:23S rRNA (pseudouridine1915-N3)-methyltransferase